MKNYKNLRGNTHVALHNIDGDKCRCPRCGHYASVKCGPICSSYGTSRMSWWECLDCKYVDAVQTHHCDNPRHATIHLDDRETKCQASPDRLEAPSRAESPDSPPARG